MCIDYHGLNKIIIIKNYYPLSLILGHLKQFGEVKIYTKIDLCRAYNLVQNKIRDE